MLLEFINPSGEEPRFEKLADMPTGLMYGMAVYTTFRLPLADHWLGMHLDRLLQNAAQLGLPVDFTPEQLQKTLLPHFQLEKPVFRLTLVADVDEYSDFYQKALKPARLLLATREAAGESPVPLTLKSVDYTRTMPLLKHLGMAEVITLKKDARMAGFQEVLLAGGGRVREASTSNIFFIRDGVICGPVPERDDCLPGITRERLLKIAKTKGLKVQSAEPILLKDLPGMEAAFLTNAAKGLMPVARIDDISFPWPDSAKAITNELSASLN